MANFHGASRYLLLNDLLEHVAAVQRGEPDSPRIALLEGPSGVGKSRLIREVYERLRDTTIGDFGQYWPTLRGQGTNAGPIAHRKVLGPPPDGLIWEPDSLPSFVWLTLAFTPAGHLPLTTSYPQIQDAMEWHSVPVMLALAELDGVGEKARQALRNARRRLAGMTADDWERLSGQALIEVTGLLGAALPGASHAFAATRSAIASLARRREQRRDLHDRVQFGRSEQSQQERASVLAQNIRSLTRRSLPAIIAIEDLHWMDDAMPFLLDELAAPDPDHPVIVMATVWPEARDHSSAYSRWLAEARSTNRVQVIPIEDLEDEALRSIIDEHAPATEEWIKGALVERWSNPYCLELFLTWDAIELLIEGEGDQRRLVIEAEDLSTRPSAIGALYAARWRSLSEPVQKALMAAAGTLPPGDAMRPFEIEIVASVLAKSATLQKWMAGTTASVRDEEVVAAHLLTAREMSWTMVSGAGDSFREPDVATVVSHHQEGLPSTIKGALREGVIRELVDRVRAMAHPTLVLDERDPDQVLAAVWLLRVDPLGDSAAHVAARYLDARLRADEGDFAGALEVSQLILGTTTGQGASETTGLDDVSRLTVELSRAGWHGEHGQTETARTSSLAIHTEAVALLGESNTLTIAARAVHAHWTGICEHKVEARQLYEALVHDLSLGIDVPDWLACSIDSGLALWVGETGLPFDASLRFEAVVREFTTHLGERDGLILQARRGQARFLGEAGRPDEAVALYRRIAADCSEWFGPRSPQNFEARRGLARWLLAAGETQEALDAYLAVERDCRDALGVDHILTLWATFGVGEAQRKAEATDQARETFEGLKVRIQILDPTHRLYDRVSTALSALDAT